MDDRALLTEYVRNGVGEAFTQIVERHRHMVYSACLRQTRDPNLAEDATQAVFIALATKARQLSTEVLLAGWLYRAARLAASAAVRAETRRRRHEEERSTMPQSSSDTDAAWQLAPLLDDALATLDPLDRNAILLRFFQQQPLKDVGATLGLSEEAARKRVTRAVQKLQTFFRARSATVSSAVIVSLLPLGVQPAPSALAASTLASGAHAPASAADSCQIIARTVMRKLWWAKAKPAAVAAAVALALSTATPIAVTYWRHVSPTITHTGVTDRLALEDTLPEISGGVQSIAFVRDGSLLAAGCGDNRVRVWNSDHQPITTLEGHRDIVHCVRFSADGRWLASSAEDGVICLWSTTDWKLNRKLTGHSQGVNAIAFSPDSQKLASASWDGTVGLWDVSNGDNLAMWRGHTSGVAAVAFSPDSMTVVSGANDHSIKLWDVVSGQVRMTIPTNDYPCSLAFSPDGKTLAVGAWGKTIPLFAMPEGKLFNTLTAHAERVQVAFSPDGQVLASAGMDSTVQLWSTRSFDCLSATHAHESPIAGVAFSPDGKSLATGSWDRTLKLWRVPRF